MYNYQRLRLKIIEKFKTNAMFCLAIGMSEHSLSVKLNNKVDFRQKEISKIIDALGLSADDIPAYFFAA